MKTKCALAKPAALVSLLLTLSSQLSTLHAQGTAFTYQGRLNEGGSPASGNYDFTFTLFATTSGSAVIAGPVTNSATAVSNGLFTTMIDFGSAAMSGGSNWLEIGVRTNGAGTFTTLSPRQQLTPAPFAILAENVSGGGLASGTYGSAVTFSNSANSFTGSYAGNGGGLTNVSGALPWQMISGTNQQAQANSGYVVTNNSLVTITLPALPNIGDVVRVSGNGVNGWKMAQNAGQSVFSANLGGGIGTTWTPRDSRRNWDGLASSADLSKLAAVVQGGQIYTSTDSGMTWTPRFISTNWFSIASSSDGSKLAAIVYGGQIYTSGNFGFTWVAGSINTNWLAIASSSDGSKLAALVQNGQIYTSTDSGTNWTAHGVSTNWASIATSSDGTKLVAAAYGGQIYTSSDSGTNWTARDSVRNWGPVASSADGTKLVAAVSGGQIYTSADSGVTWVAQAGSSSQNWASIASSPDGTMLIAVVIGGQIYNSMDSGVTWVARAFTDFWNSVVSSADGTKLVAVAQSDFIYTSVPSTVSSTTTGTAGCLFGKQNSAIELQYLGNGQFIPISHEGIILEF